MSLTTGWSELNSALKTMRLRWEDIQESWNDPVSRDFDANHWQPLEQQVVTTLRAMDRLAPILMRAQRECS
jgi:hypothetical protein